MDYNNNYESHNDELKDGPGYMYTGSGNDPVSQYQNYAMQSAEENQPRRLDDNKDNGGNNGNGFNGSSGDHGGKKPQKEKSPFLTKKVAAVVLSLCIGASAVFGFGAGMMAGNGQTTPNTTTSNGVVQVSENVSTTGTDLSISDIANKVQPSIVEINTEVVTTNQFMQQVSGEAAGSGIIISSDGYIVTNNHVIEDAQSITVRLSTEESYEAKLIGRDPQMDLAVLKIDAEGLTPVTMGDSGELSVGDTTVAVGNPLGTLGGTVTNGIVSALNREIDLGDGTMTLIQTNAAINPGNSGGGLFNGQGELIGVVVAKSGGTNVEGLGYAIPVNDAQPIINELMSNGYVSGRVDIGMDFVDISSAQEAMMYGLSSTGVFVQQTTSGSQAQQIGIKSGDRVVSIDDQEVSTAAEISKILEGHSVGDTVKITIERSGRTASTDLTLTESVPSNS
ncbi:MAG: trypsin-like peptidase domain-containing protein [Christensenella sp.]|nr:trypsin-like peptidase domain-containing protein [Christensenella sp.]